MILPIVVYGDPVLRKVGVSIDKHYEGLESLIANMFETTYNAKGVGLAAPQIGKSIRLFIADTSPFAEIDEEEEEEEQKMSKKEQEFLKNFKRVFINAKILGEKGEGWKFNEGCLSIPKIREDVERKSIITIEYYDEHFKKQIETLDGLAARVVQHEYDHIEGKLFTDRISPFKRKILAGKLNDISNGKFSADYMTKVYKGKR
ncbi:MAG: peptide deformylase [Bacteroidia bacterium]